VSIANKLEDVTCVLAPTIRISFSAPKFPSCNADPVMLPTTVISVVVVLPLFVISCKVKLLASESMDANEADTLPHPSIFTSESLFHLMMLFHLILRHYLR